MSRKANFKTVMQNGLLFSIRPTHVGTGKSKRLVGNALCPQPTESTAPEYLKQGLFTMEEVWDGFVKAEAIKIQANLRNPTKSDKPTIAERNEIINTLMTPDVIAEFAATDNMAQAMETWITVEWKKMIELATAEFNEIDEIDEIDTEVAEAE